MNQNRRDMSTSEKNESVGGADKYVSKSKKKKAQLIHFSKDKIGPLQVSVGYASVSSENLIPKNINWHKSQWPELPKSRTSSSQVDSGWKEESQLGGSSSQHESSSKKGNKTELSKKSGDWGCSPGNHLEDITCSLSALKLAVTKNADAELSQQSCLKKTSSPTRRKGKKLKTPFVGNYSFAKINQEAVLARENYEQTTQLVSNNQQPICSEDFPHLLVLKKIKKGKIMHSYPVEDLSAKKISKKYPRKNDPIFINLGEVLEHSSNTQNTKIVLRSRYDSRHFRSGKSPTHTSRRVIKRGKQREFPQKKIMTKLKVAILKGRQQKINSRLHSQGNALYDSPCVTAVEDGQTLQAGETVFDLTYLFGHCSSDENLPIRGLQSASDLRDIHLETCEKKQEKSHSAEHILQLAKTSIHNRKFREYCNNDNCTILQEKVKSFVKQIYRFQSKAHFRDAEKAKIHRRYALGLREADKYFKLRKLKVVVIATDVEANSEEGGLDEIIDSMKKRASKENIPIIFALKRRDLAYCVYRKVPVSCMAVLNYEGAEDLYRDMINSWREAAVTYDKKLKQKQQSILYEKRDSRKKPREGSSPTPTGNLESACWSEAQEELICEDRSDV